MYNAKRLSASLTAWTLVCLVTTQVPCQAQNISDTTAEKLQIEIEAANARSDYDSADKLCRRQLDLLKQNERDRNGYAKALRQHAEVLKHSFDFAGAQTEEREAQQIEVQSSAADAVNVPSPKPVAPKLGASAPKHCALGEARYTVKTAIGPMDCHLMHDGKGLVRMMNEEDPRIQFVINYPTLKCRVLADESVNKGKIYNSEYWPTHAPPFIDESGAVAAGAKCIGNRTINGHPCTGWSKEIVQGLHVFETETWLASDLRFPCEYTWAMRETPNNKVTWSLAVFNATPRSFVFDLSGYKESGETWAGNPWLKWMLQ